MIAKVTVTLDVDIPEDLQREASTWAEDAMIDGDGTGGWNDWLRENFLPYVLKRATTELVGAHRGYEELWLAGDAVRERRFAGRTDTAADASGWRRQD